ncbi:hypothetical protein [Sphingomonas hylomeconis]|uniref:MarR family transcriptional regulator n=1 Tax=Sphingomonas hylomeconis TaxID=1395958 RepID=A0ABV7SRE4_9SPHN|nr:hypothetical protein [Sphingomonas hylomeconis]
MIQQDDFALLAMALLRIRRARARNLPADLFSEPAWDLLLELFVADAQGSRITGGEVSSRNGIHDSVMSKWLRHMTKIGLLIGDGTGNLNDLLTLSAKGLAAMENTLSETLTAAGAVTSAD